MQRGKRHAEQRAGHHTPTGVCAGHTQHSGKQASAAWAGACQSMADTGQANPPGLGGRHQCQPLYLLPPPPPPLLPPFCCRASGSARQRSTAARRPAAG
jgi:hypothetical protein